ncbi:PREDICTED: limbic system-associated membrane protein-like [Acropora digitifera]|uniref:limbic system-associated membrane protein-like n=1 Tax=Acropora digitifera TaxID=70779 RepID=UPI00077B1618|nr:PREDICTED: limbic system-associated membrane protein-like [Acropora digitifera]
MEGGNVTLNCSSDGKPKPIITWTRLSDNKVVTMPLINIKRDDEKDYKCTAENGVGTPATREVTIDVQYPTEATGPGENATEAEGGVKMFSCPVDGNPEPNITWYNEKTGRSISSGKQLEAKEGGCYTCVARNTVGPAVNITQCLIIMPPSTMSPDAFLTTVPPSTLSPDALLTTVSPSTMSPGKRFVFI